MDANDAEKSFEDEESTSRSASKILTFGEPTDKEEQSCSASTNQENTVDNLKYRSASKSSSLNEDPKSFIDSISATSARHQWSNKEIADDDPSISSIKGDSISATIADYNRKHQTQLSDNLSRTSARMAGGESSRNDDVSSNINFYAAGSSTSGIGNPSLKPGDFVSVSSNANLDAFDIIEETSNLSSSDDFNSKTNKTSKQVKRHTTRNYNHYSSSIDQNFEIDDLPQDAAVYQIEPIVIRGNGNLTLFGLSNSFSTEFPSALIGRVSREEFDHTMRKVNTLLREQQSLSAKLLLVGSLFCCCSFGFSLIGPSIALKKRSKISLQKLLINENNRLYSKLGLNWKLSDQRCYSNHAFIEYVIMIEFIPKVNLYVPD